MWIALTGRPPDREFTGSSTLACAGAGDQPWSCRVQPGVEVERHVLRAVPVPVAGGLASVSPRGAATAESRGLWSEGPCAHSDTQIQKGGPGVHPANLQVWRP
jgi:hypothetical protein